MTLTAVIIRDQTIDECIAALAAVPGQGEAILTIKAMKSGIPRLAPSDPPYSYVREAVRRAQGNASGYASLKTPLGTLEVDHFKTDSGWNRTEYRLDGERVPLRTLDLMGLNQRHTRRRRNKT